MILTPKMKQWCVEQKGLSADASDDDIRKAVTDALLDGTLTSDVFADLSKSEDARTGSALATAMESIAKTQSAILEKLTATPEPVVPPDPPAKPQIKETAPAAPTAEGGDTKATSSVFEKMFAGSQPGQTDDTNIPTVRVVGAHERYKTTKTAAHYPEVTQKGGKHPLAGMQVKEGKRAIDQSSELDLAVAGAHFKWAIHIDRGGINVPRALKMTEHDRDLVQYALHECKWGGIIHGEGSEDPGSIAVNNQKLSNWQIKAILDDATSGGLELAPIAFDDAVILTPLLFGELFPRVRVETITRGRRIEGGSIGNVTLSSGGADGTAIPLFATASFIAAFDTTIFVANGAIEIGLDFLSDSPVDVAGIVTEEYGRVLMAWLDEQIAIGDGTTEPEGITVASGTTTVNASGGAGGPPTVGDYEAMLFGVSKQFKQGFSTEQIAFAANETTYRRARAIAVGSADARRVFGMTHEDYRLFGHPYAINGNFGNRSATFTNFGRYRMYRRLGLAIKTTTEGKELTRANQMLITARARYGGQLESGSASAVQADGQS